MTRRELVVTKSISSIYDPTPIEFELPFDFAKLPRKTRRRLMGEQILDRHVETQSLIDEINFKASEEELRTLGFSHKVEPETLKLLRARKKQKNKK